MFYLIDNNRMDEINVQNLNEPLIAIENSQLHQQQQEKQKKQSINPHLKAALFIGTIFLISLFNFVPFLSPLSQGECYYDRLFEITHIFNAFFAYNISYRNILLIVTSMFADILAVLTMAIWCFKSKDSVFLLASIGFYLLRYLVMEIFLLGFPHQYLFTYPGLKSIFVSYLPTNDFFFSGHTGFPVIVYLEFSRYKGKVIPTLAMTTLTMHFFTMLALHGHYSIDLLIGSFSAYYVFKKTVKVLKYLNQE